MDTKTIWTSKTIWGAVIMVLPILLPLVGINVSEGDIATGVSKVQTVLNSGLELFGFAMVIIGRMKARGPATILPK